jgi:hypothetical protein
MELVYANNIFIIALLLTLMNLYFKKNVYLMLSIVFYFTYIVIVLNNEINRTNIIYSVFLCILTLFLIKQLFK